MKDTIKRLIGYQDFRLTLIISPILLVAFIVSVVSIKSCNRYEDCVSACGGGRYGGNDSVSDITIKCLEYCD